MQRRRKSNWQRKRMKMGLAILCAAFGIVVLTKWIEDYTGQKVFQAEVFESELDLGEATEEKDTGKVGKEDENDANPNIRVLLMTNGYKGTVHSKIALKSESGLIVSFGEEKESVKAKKVLSIEPDDERFEEGMIKVQSEGKIVVESLERGYGAPSYDGSIELYSTAEGIVIINELPVESYLCAVVPSEMPASYELEALKAQAVCARSYAYRQMEAYAYPKYKAHVNDSTAYQVYGNSKSQKSSTKAVRQTKGETVCYKGNVVTTYYFSTSCGKTTTMEAWGTKKSKKNAYLKSVDVSGENGDYEKDYSWYQWEAKVPVETLSNLIGLNTGKDIGTLKSLKVTKRGPGNIALAMKAVGTKGSITIKTENKIRTALGGAGYQIKRQDGTTVDSSKLLPSAFIDIHKKGDIFVIEGGGFGHGIGMSQNGANEMAKAGKDYKEILKLFYSNVTIE